MEKTPLRKQLRPWPSGQENLKGSKMLQPCFSICPCRQVSKAQGHIPRGEKVPKLRREKWECRRAVYPEGQETLLGHISGPRRMQDLPSQHLPQTSQSLSGQYLQGGANPLSSIRDPGVPPLPRKHRVSFYGHFHPWHGGTSCGAVRGLALSSTTWSSSSF